MRVSRAAGWRLLVPAVLLGGAAGLAACGGGGVPATTQAAPPTTTPGAVLSTEQSPVGRILATGSGHTLYDFVLDDSTHSACTSSGCVVVWPPLLVHGTPAFGPGVKRSLVSEIHRPDGTTQLAYGGHPLYTYTGDSGPGVVSGQGLDQSGGPWYVVSPSGKQITQSFSVIPGS